MFTLPPLPYAMNALSPILSEETLAFHYGKHHQAYVTNLNKLTQDSEWAQCSLEEIIMKSTGPIFNNAAQIWNHTFYWNGLTPNSALKPSGTLAEAITQQFGSFEIFKEKFTQSAATLFGSGWTWLVLTSSGELEIMNTFNANLPMKENKKALLTCDVWEHAYYIDYRNARPQYLEKFWELVNWEVVAAQFMSA